MRLGKEIKSRKSNKYDKILYNHLKWLHKRKMKDVVKECLYYIVA